MASIVFARHKAHDFLVFVVCLTNYSVVMVFFEECGCYNENSVLHSLNIVVYSQSILLEVSSVNDGERIVQLIGQEILLIVGGGAVELLILGLIEGSYLGGVRLNFQFDNILVVFCGFESKVSHRAVVDVLEGPVVVSSHHHIEVITLLLGTTIK